MYLRQVETYFMIYVLYSVAGWIMESGGNFIRTKKFINRGFLIGPYCPVYGCGVLLITLLLQKYVNDIPVLFVMTIVVCGTLEYFTSFIMEKLFNARWWDYKNQKFNINGRICLETLIPFSIAGVTFLKFVNPIYINAINKIPDVALNWVSGSIFVIMFIDTIVSFTIISKLRKVSKEIDIENSETKDNTEEISKLVKAEVDEISEKISNDAGKIVRKASNVAEDVAMEITSKAYHNLRKVDINRRRFTRKVNRKKEKLHKEIEERRSFIVKKFNKETKRRFAEISILHRRITNAFPDMKVIKKNYKEKNKKK